MNYILFGQDDNMITADLIIITKSLDKATNTLNKIVKKYKNKNYEIIKHSDYNYSFVFRNEDEYEDEGKYQINAWIEEHKTGEILEINKKNWL